MDKISSKNLKKGVPFLAAAAFLVLMLLIPPTRAFFVGVFGWVVIVYTVLAAALGVLFLFGKKVKMSLGRAGIAVALVVMMICTLHIVFAKKIFNDGNYLLDPYRGFDTVGGVVISAITVPFKLLFRNNYTAMLVVYFLVTAGLGLLMLYPYIVALDKKGKNGRPMREGQAENTRLHTEKVQKTARVTREAPAAERLPKLPEDRPRFERAPESTAREYGGNRSAEILFGNSPVSKDRQDTTPHFQVLDQYDESLSMYTNQGRERLVQQNGQFAMNNEEEYRKRYGDMPVYGKQTQKTAAETSASVTESTAKEPQSYSYFSGNFGQTEPASPYRKEEDTAEERREEHSVYGSDDAVHEEEKPKKQSMEDALAYINTPIDQSEYENLYGDYVQRPSLYTQPVTEPEEEPKSVQTAAPEEEERKLFAELVAGTPEEHGYTPVEEVRREREPFANISEPMPVAPRPEPEEKPVEKIIVIPPSEPAPKKETAFVQKDTPNGTRIRMTEPAAEKKAEPLPKEEEKAEELPKLPYKPVPYVAPPLDLMKQYPNTGETFPENYPTMKADIDRTMEEFGVPATVTGAKRGPTFTRYELALGAGYPVRRVVNLEENLMMRLKVKSLRILAPIRGEDAFGIEVPNEKRDMVGLRSVLSGKEFNATDKGIQLAFGKTLEGDNFVADLAKMPHLLVAGATGTGKSVFINSLIVSILYKYGPEDVRLLLIDPKRVEMSVYRNLPNLLISETIKEPQHAVNLLKWLTEEMDRRYSFLEEVGCNNIEQYNDTVRDKEKEPKMARIVLIIDEMADLMVKGKGQVEEYIVRLAQLARAAGIHMVLATQRPTKNVITGLIKANILARVAFTVKTNLDSRVIFDEGGAESLLGNGDMIYSFQSELTRMQGAFVSNEEVRAICSFIRAHNEAKFDANIAKEILNEKEPEPQIDLSAMRQEQASADFEDKLKMVLKGFILDNRASVSSAQSKFGVGYIKAKKLVDAMTERGYLSKEDGAKPRDILITLDEYYEIYGRD